MTTHAEIVTRHARELLAELDESGIAAMTETDRAYLIGQLQHNVRALLTLVDERGSDDA